MSPLQKTWYFAVVGAILSAYALHVEHVVAHKPPEEEFNSLCDIDAIGASCSSVFQLPEGRLVSYFGIVPNGHILDVPNAAIGLTYYILWLTIMPFFLPKPLNLLIASLALSFSIFLAIQLLILKELCVLCWSTHIINSRLWWNAFSTFRGGGGTSTKTSSSSGDSGKAKIKRV